MFTVPESPAVTPPLPSAGAASATLLLSEAKSRRPTTGAANRTRPNVGFFSGSITAGGVGSAGDFRAGAEGVSTRSLVAAGLESPFGVAENPLSPVRIVCGFVAERFASAFTTLVEGFGLPVGDDVPFDDDPFGLVSEASFPAVVPELAAAAVVPFAVTLRGWFEYQYQPPPAASNNPAASNPNFNPAPDPCELSAASGFSSRANPEPKFGAGPSPENVNTASWFESESCAAPSGESDSNFWRSFESEFDVNVSTGSAKTGFGSSAFASCSSVAGILVSSDAEVVEEFRARGSSHAGIFTSSAAKSKVYVPGAGFSRTGAGTSNLVSDSFFSSSLAVLAGAAIVDGCACRTFWVTGLTRSGFSSRPDSP